MSFAKKILKIAAVALLVIGLFGNATPASAAYSQIVHSFAAGGAATSVTTGNLTTTGGDLIIVAVTDYSVSSLGSVSDNKSNTWTQLTAQTGSVARTTFWYAKNPTVGSNHTFTYSGCSGTCYPTIYVQVWSGSDLTAPFDVENGAKDSGLTTIQTGSITPNNANSLVVSAVNFWTNTNNPTVDSSMTLDDSRVYNPGFEFGGGIAYIVQGSAAAINPTWSANVSGGNAAVIAAFKAASGGGGGGTPAARRRSPSPNIID